MKKLMMTAAAIAISATSAFAAAPSDVEHRVDNPYSYSSWANAFYIEYANEFGGQAFTNLPNTITTLENIVVSAQNELENEYTSYQIYLDTGMEADAELSQIQIYALSGKIQGTNKLIATIEGLHDTSALDDANDQIDNLNDQLAYWGGVVADQKAELDGIEAMHSAHVEALTTAHDSVTAELDAEVADLEASVMTATEVNTGLKGELFTANANNELLVTELNTANELANNNYDSLLDSVKTLEAEAKVAEESHAAAVDAIAEYNSNDAARYENDPAAHMHAIYGYVLQLRAQLGL